MRISDSIRIWKDSLSQLVRSYWLVSNPYLIEIVEEEKTFDEQHQNDKIDYFDFRGSFFIRSNDLVKCSHCNKLTHWIEGIFNKHVCSPACFDAMWSKYWRDRFQEIKKY